MLDANRTRQLLASGEMEPVQGGVDVAVPADELWEAFTRADQWPKWNGCFWWVRNRTLSLGDYLAWCFQPIRWWYLYKMPAIAKIVEYNEKSRVTWEVTALPGFYARHTYTVEDLGGGRARFTSWEKAMGWSLRLTKSFWIAHFTFVKDRSLEGARTLESIYATEGNLGRETLDRETTSHQLLMAK